MPLSYDTIKIVLVLIAIVQAVLLTAVTVLFSRLKTLSDDFYTDLDGLRGPPGPPGPAGPEGKRGRTPLTRRGIGVPPDETGLEGDQYIDLRRGEFWLRGLHGWEGPTPCFGAAARPLADAMPTEPQAEVTHIFKKDDPDGGR